MTKKIGGSFAPPLSDEILAAYKAAIDALPVSAIKDALLVLHNCCVQWWNHPESSGAVARQHPLGIATIVELDEPIKAALFDHIPWKEELEAMKPLFAGIQDVPLRDLAHHLLWHAVELELDREPLTNDKLAGI